MSIAHGEDNVARLQFDASDRMSKALRVAGVTSAEMAEYLGVSRNTISNWITGKRPVKKQTLRLWAIRTGVPMEWLEKGELNKENPSGGEPEGQAWPATGSGPGYAPRDSNPEPIDSGSNVVPLFGGVAA